MKKVFLENWGKVVVGVVLAAVVIINFRPGYFILGNDNYSPELNPKLAVERYLGSPGWRSYRALGVASDADQADIFRSGIYWLLGKVLPLWLVSQGFIFLTFGAGVFGAGWLTKQLLAGKRDEGGGEWLFLAGAIGYGFNLLGIWVFFSPLIPFMVVWGWLPWMVGWWWRFWQKGETRTLWKLVAINMVVAVTGIVPTIFIVEVLALGAWSILGLARWYKVIGWTGWIKRTMVLWGMFFIFNAHWLGSFAVYVKTNSAALQHSYINRMLTPNMVESEVKYNTWFNVPRYYTSWLEVQNDDGSFVYPQYEWFRNDRRGVLFSLIPVLGILLGIWGVVKIKRWAWMVVVMWSAGWFLIKGVNPPMGGVYGWLQEHIPLFEQVFRWQSSKIWPFMAITSALLVGAGYLWLRKSSSLLAKGWIMIVAISGIINVWPWWNGKMIQERNYVKVPQKYFELAKWLKNKDSEGRVYLLPEANTLYFRNHDWGFWGSSLWNYLIPNPIMEKAMTTGSEESEAAQRLMEAVSNSGKGEEFEEILRQYKVRYVAADRSVSWRVNGYNFNWDRLEAALQSGGLASIWSNDGLELYEVKSNEVSEHWPVMNGQVIKNLNLWFAENKEGFDYVAANDGVVWPVAIGKDGVEYLGENQKYKLAINEQTVSQLPLLTRARGGSLELAAGLPEIKINGKVELAQNEIVVGRGELGDGEVVSVGDRVNPIRAKGIMWPTTIEELGANPVVVWGAQEAGWQKATPTEKWVSYWVAPNSGPVKIKIDIKTRGSGQINFCAWDEESYRCLNQLVNTGLSEGQNQREMWLGENIRKDKKLTFYVNPADSDTAQVVEEIAVEARQLIKGIIVEIDLPNKEREWTLELKRGDKLEWGGVKMTREWAAVGGEWRAEGNGVECNAFWASSSGNDQEREVGFWARDCWGGMSSKWWGVNPKGGVGRVEATAVNISGIPLDLAIRSNKTRTPWWQERMGVKGENRIEQMFVLPDEENDYTVEVFNNGIGPRPSENVLKNMEIGWVPQAWGQIRLIPDSLRPVTDIWGINQAVSRSWRAEGNNQKVIINGWEQGWRGERGRVYFWPDYLVWGGYAAQVVFLLGLAVYGLKQKQNQGKVGKPGAQAKK